MDIGNLGDVPDDHLLLDSVPKRDHAPGLHRLAGPALDGQAFADDVPCRGKGLAGVAGLQLDLRGDIGIPIAVNYRRVGLRRALEIDNGRLRVVVDVNEFRSVFGEVAGLGDHRGDRLTDISDLPVGQHRRFRRVRERRIGVAVREDPRRGGKILRHDHGDDAFQLPRLARVHRDRGPGGGAAHDREVQHPGVPDIVDEPSPAGKKRAVLGSCLPLPEQGHVGSSGPAQARTVQGRAGFFDRPVPRGSSAQAWAVREGRGMTRPIPAPFTPLPGIIGPPRTSPWRGSWR